MAKRSRGKKRPKPKKPRKGKGKVKKLKGSTPGKRNMRSRAVATGLVMLALG